MNNHFDIFKYNIKNTRFRSLSPHRLVASLDRLHEAVGASGFYFVDDCFVDAPPIRVLDFCQRLKERGAPYRLGCDIQLSELKQPVLLAELHSAGFRCFYLGIEAASPKVRKRLGKAPIEEPLERAIRRASDLGLFIRASVGVGWPGETLAEMQSTLELLARLPHLLFDAYRYAPLGGVPLSSWTGRSPAPRVISPFEDYSELSTNHSQLPDEEMDNIWASLRQLELERLQRYFGATDS